MRRIRLTSLHVAPHGPRALLRLTAASALALCLLGGHPGQLPAGADGEAQAPQPLSIRWAAGATTKVEQRLDLENTNRGSASFGGGAGHAATIVKGHVTITEEWSDKVTSAEGVEAVEVVRTYKSSKLRAQRNAAAATSLQGAVLALTAADRGATARVTKGKPTELAQALLRKAPLEPVQLLLPKKPVSPGGTWQVSVEDLQTFQSAICIGCAAAEGGAASDISVLLAQLEGSGPAAVGKLVNGTWTTLKDDVATLTFADDKTHDSDAPVRGPLFDVPASKTTLSGTLTFNVATGRPIRLEWKQLHESGDFTPPPSIGGPTVPGFKENWTLLKTWK